MKKITSGLLATGFLVSSLMVNFSASASVETQVKSNVTGISEKLVKEMGNKSELFLSSNPPGYDYIKASAEYQNT
jgi:hypothetical protein